MGPYWKRRTKVLKLDQATKVHNRKNQPSPEGVLAPEQFKCTAISCCPSSERSRDERNTVELHFWDVVGVVTKLKNEIPGFWCGQMYLAALQAFIE